MSLTAQIKHAARVDFVRVFPRLTSTNTYAVNSIEASRLPAGEGVIIAMTQTGGRGRGNNRWWSTAGSVTATFVMRAVDGMSPAQVPLRAGLAVLETAARFVPDRDSLRLKWPNDVLAVTATGAKKIAGILCERVRGYDIIGIGLNVGNDFSAAPEDVRRRAVSLRELGASPAPPIADVIVTLAIALRAERDAADWLTRFSGVHYLNGRAITVSEDGRSVSGVCEGVQPDGRLVLRVGGKRKLISGGTVGF